jgi:hypothetical protein
LEENVDMRQMKAPGSVVFILVCASTNAASVSGLTVDAFSRQPIGNVNVKLHCGVNPSADRETRSDEKGHFVFADIRDGGYFPFAELAGYHRVAAVVQGRAEDGIVLKPGGRIEGVRILMAGDAVISGRVVDEDGAPVQGAKVEAWPLPEDRPTIVREGKNGALTDRDGEYRYVVTPGEYRITALAPSPRPYAGSDVFSSQGFFFSSRHEPGGVVVEAIPVVETRHVDVHLRTKTGLTISGRVSGVPPEPGRVELYVESGSSLEDLNYTRLYTLKSADKFELNDLHPGFYRIYASYWNSKVRLHSQIIELSLDSKNGRQLELILAAKFTVVGTVEREHGRLLERELYIRRTGPGYSPFSRQSPIVHIRGDGTFEIPDLVPDRYELETEPRSGSYIKQILLGDTELKDQILDLGHGAPGAALKIILGDRSASLTVKLVDRTGRPLNDGSVLVVPDGKVTEVDCVMRWNAPSSATIGCEGLAPGHYRVIWIFEPFPGAVDASRIRQLSKDAELVEIREGDRITKTLRMP